MIEITCPKCGKQFKKSDEDAYSVVHCPFCFASMTLNIKQSESATAPSAHRSPEKVAHDVKIFEITSSVMWSVIAIYEMFLGLQYSQLGYFALGAYILYVVIRDFANLKYIYAGNSNIPRSYDENLVPQILFLFVNLLFRSYIGVFLCGFGLYIRYYVLKHSYAFDYYGYWKQRSDNKIIEHLKKYKISYIILAAVLIFAIYTNIISPSNPFSLNSMLYGNSSTPATTTANNATQATPQPIATEKPVEFVFVPENYRSDITYEQLARTPDQYTGERITFIGNVIQVMEDEDVVYLRVSTDEWYEEIYFVQYPKSLLDARILENDTVTIYGEYTGLYEYQSLWGQQVIIPSLNAEHIDLSVSNE